LYQTFFDHDTDILDLPGAANQCILSNVYLRNNLLREHNGAAACHEGKSAWSYACTARFGTARTAVGRNIEHMYTN
jgi:hypothetical protein